MAEIPYKEWKWRELPSIPEPNSKYFIVSADGKYFRFFITTAFGDLVELDVSAASVTTLKFFFGNGNVPDGYIQKGISTFLQDATLVGVKIVGFMLVNGTPYEASASGILFDPNTGTLDLSVFGEFYDGGTVVVMVNNGVSSESGTIPAQSSYTDRRDKFQGSTGLILQLNYTRVPGKNVAVFLRGVLLDEADYTLGNKTVTLNIDRTVDDVFTVIYTSVD